MTPVEFGDDRLPERFWEKVHIVPEASTYPGPCWIWNAALVWDGYGRFKWEKKTLRAHRFCYQTLVSDVPPELNMDHLCRVRSCVNPYHLEPVTVKENLLRGNTLNAEMAAKTHCLRGHPLSGINLYVVPKSGARACKECHRASQRRRSKERKEANS